jgi:hypothetical protein
VLIEVNQSIDADHALAVGVGANLDALAAPSRADFKSRSVFREGIGPLFVVERDRYQELLVAGSRLGVVERMRSR